MAGGRVGHVACREMSAAHVVKRRLGVGAQRGDHLAACVEAAAGGGLIGLGGSPEIGASWVRLSGSIDGMEASSASV